MLSNFGNGKELFIFTIDIVVLLNKRIVDLLDSGRMKMPRIEDGTFQKL